MAAALSAHASRWTIASNADINVTPFVDVMLVLLIIFMVAIPVSTVSVKVDLPQAQAAPPTAQPPLVVSLTLGGRVYVGDKPTTVAELPALVAATLGQGSAERRIYIRADEGVSYGALMAMMNQLRVHGFDKVALVGEDI
jgi:biopolymer transport protein ExbD